MLYTNLKYIDKADEYNKFISETENAVIICGSMSHTCIPMYAFAEELNEVYEKVTFFDMEFENPESQIIRNLPELKGFTDIPLTIFLKNGKIVKATSGIQTKTQIITIIEEYFKLPVHA